VVPGRDVGVLTAYGHSVSVTVQRTPGRDLGLMRVPHIDDDQLLAPPDAHISETVSNLHGLGFSSASGTQVPRCLRI
jgi:hypothetical protein